MEKKSKFLLSILLSGFMLAGCTKPKAIEDENCEITECETCQEVHEHTYKTEWSTNQLMHWHDATCEHTDQTKDLGEHTYGINGKCTVCGYEKEAEHFGFSFRSDCYELDNQETYEEGEDVELSLTVKEALKGIVALPNDIEVYSNGVLLTKNTDYTYEIVGESGKLSLSVKGNIVVLAFNDKNVESFRVTEDQFNDAMNVADEEYVQFNLKSGFYSSYTIIMQENAIEYSPNIVYRGNYSLTTSRYSGSFVSSYSYIEKEDGVYTEYWSDNSGIWTTSESNEDAFNGNKVVPIGWYPFMTGYSLSYSNIKDNFNSATNAYETSFTYQEYDVNLQATFHNGKLIDITYNGTFSEDRGIYGNISVSYLEKEVLIPNDAKPHDHTYASAWTSSATHHWHAATCEHTDQKGDYGFHTYNDEGICTVCGYSATNLYPIITKAYERGEVDSTNTWADDLSYVIADKGDEKAFMDFDEDGNVVDIGYFDGDTKEIYNTYTYENGLVTSKELLEDGSVSFKEVYTYNEDKKPLCNQYYEYKDSVEHLCKQENFEYFDDYWTETTMTYNEDAQKLVFDGLDKWTITTEGENTKHTLERQYVENGEFTFRGHLIYNKFNQLIERKTIETSPVITFYKYLYITYTDDGSISTLIEYSSKSNAGQKQVWTYNEQGFVISQNVYEYNSKTSEYDILAGGHEYIVDSRGTIIKDTAFQMIPFGDEFVRGNEDVIEYEIKYVPIEFKIGFIGLTAETKGSYNRFELEAASIIN